MKKLIIKKTIYCDMDGVLADFNGADGALNRFQSEQGFFQKLKPFERNVAAIKRLIADGNDVYILSASPNETADGDKIMWLKKYLPTLADGHAIIMRCGANKVHYMRTADGILFDDYSKNLNQWVDGEYTNLACKVAADGDIWNIAQKLATCGL